MTRSIESLTRVVHVSTVLLLASCSEAGRTMTSRDPEFAEEIVNSKDFMYDASPGDLTLDGGAADAPSGLDVMDAAVPDCPGEARAAYQIFANRCVICHVSENLGHGNFGGVLSARSMIATGHVVPYAPEQSPVYLRVESGDMPRVGMRLTPIEVGHIESWIRCGAPPFERERSDAGAWLGDDAGEDAGTPPPAEGEDPI